MKKTALLLLLLGALSPVLSGQIKRAPVLAGLESGGTVIHYARQTGITPSLDWAVRVNPYLMVRIGRHGYAGIGYSREMGMERGNALPVLNEAGIQLRRYLPVRFRSQRTADRFQFYGGASWYLLDYRLDNQTGPQPLGTFRNHQVGLRAGAQFRLFTALYADLAGSLYFFSEGKSPVLTPLSLALEYHFGEKRPPLPPPQTKAPEEGPFRLYDPSGLLEKIVLGASYTFIFDGMDTDDLFHYREHTLNLNVAVALGADLDLGLAWLGIRTRTGEAPPEGFSLRGAFVQYNFLRGVPGRRLFAETGFYRGNICTCGEEEPYFRPNLSYLPFGGGFEAPLFKSKHWFIDLSFLWYQLLSRVPGTHTWALSQYVIGLNYQIRP